jgi:3',5'-cyclic AMP phosphodiesterase CpdA
MAFASPLPCGRARLKFGVRAVSRQLRFQRVPAAKRVRPPLEPSATATSPEVARFALISDVHVFDGEGLWREDVMDFNLHRLLGLANILVMRGPGKYSTDVLAASLVDMKRQGVQHLVCAGDITNLAMEAEFSKAAAVFEGFGPPEKMTFCPGNHDIYVPAQRDGVLFRKYFGKYCESDVAVRSPRGDGFPFLQLRGGIAFLGLNTGIPNTAAGETGEAQWRAANEMMRSREAQDLLRKAQYRVLVQHHPAQDPNVRGTTVVRQFGHGYRDWRELGAFVSEHAFDLVVHGHLHKPYRARLSMSPKTLVYESGSGTLMVDDPERVARYTVFELDGSSLVRTYSRVWNRRGKVFDTHELSIPA